MQVLCSPCRSAAFESGTICAALPAPLPQGAGVAGAESVRVGGSPVEKPGRNVLDKSGLNTMIIDQGLVRSP